MADNNEKYYAPTGDQLKQSFAPTTYASSNYASQNYADAGGYYNGEYYDPEKPKSTDVIQQAIDEVVLGEMAEREAGRGDPNAPSGKKTERNADNNYGYASFGLAGDIAGAVGKAVGGPLGMAIGAPGKLAGIDNLSAVQAARKDLGLKTTEVGAKQVAGTLAKGTKNATVGRVNIGNVTYDVSLDPKEVGKINKQGIATISPPQAKQIATENQATITEAPATPDTPKEKGPVGRALAAAKEALTGVKTEAPSAPTPGQRPSTPSLGATPSTVGATPGPGYNPANQAQLDSTRNTTRNTTAPTSKGYAAGMGPLSGITTKDQGPKRPGQVAPEVTDTVRDVVGSVLGPGYSVSVTSGLGEYGKQNHRAVNAIDGLGAAMDFSVIDNETGKKVTDPNKLGAVALGLSEIGGMTGIGFGPGYMGGTTFHADLVGRNTPKAWGQNESFAGMKKNTPELAAALAASMADTKAVTQNFKDTMEKTTPGVPTSREIGLGLAKDTALTGPDTISRNMYDTQYGTPAAEISRNMYDTQYGTPAAVAAAEALNNPSTPSSVRGMQTIGDMTQGIDNGFASLNQGYTPGTQMSPSNLSTVGLGREYSPENVRDISYAVAGELGPQTRAALATPGTPEYGVAVSETAAIVDSVRNRVDALQNVGYKDPVNAALTAGYDSVNKGFAQKNTAQAFAQDGVNVTSTVQGIIDGTLGVGTTTQQATHYGTPGALKETGWANPDVAAPSQMAAAQSFSETAQNVGQHTFGNLGPTERGMAPSAKGYGTAYGPAGAVGVTGMSGMSHTPGAMYGDKTATAGTPGGMAAAGTNALGGGLGLGGGYVDSGVGSISGTNTGLGSTAPADGKKGNESTNSGLGGTSSSANGNSAGSQSGASGSSSSGNGNSSGSGSGGSDGAGSSGSGAGGSSGSGGTGAGGRGSDRDGDGRGR